jgi:hypothetical protein
VICRSRGSRHRRTPAPSGFAGPRRDRPLRAVRPVANLVVGGRRRRRVSREPRDHLGGPPSRFCLARAMQQCSALSTALMLRTISTSADRVTRHTGLRRAKRKRWGCRGSDPVLVPSVRLVSVRLHACSWRQARRWTWADRDLPLRFRRCAWLEPLAWLQLSQK